MALLKRLVFDIEGNNLVRYITKLWCICICDLSSPNHIEQYTPSSISEGLSRLSEADIIIGHNICGFDIPAIKKLYPDWSYKSARDTYCMSKLFNPERTKGHSLESYGEEFGIVKPEHEDWTQYSPEMLHRCTEDVKINTRLYQELVMKHCTNWNWLDALLLEQEDTLIQIEQEENGVDFNKDEACKLIKVIDTKINNLSEELLLRLPKRIVSTGTVNNPFKKDRTYIKKVQEWISSYTIK